MEGKLIPISRSISDAEAMKQLEESTVWQMMRAKFAAMEKSHTTTLETSDSLNEIKEAQGALKALRRVMELPGIIRAELKK